MNFTSRLAPTVTSTAVTSAAVLLGTLLLATPAAARQTIGCTTGGAGGSIPTSGTGDGLWPNTLPSAPMIAPLSVTSIPAGATGVTEVKLFALGHTWIGDVQIVLQDPSGALHNVFYRPGSFGGGLGYSCDYAGDYFFVESGGMNIPAPCTGGTLLPPGTYNQIVGDWPSGTNGIDNLALGQIPISVGTWTLYAYDWAGGDVGSMASWDLCFGTPPPPPPPPPPTNCSAPVGGGGPIPTTGTGDGTWDTVLPSAPLVASASVTVPAGSTRITAVKLDGLNHTWIGDLQFTLEDPSGVQHNLVCRPGGGGPGLGLDCDVSGDYAIYETYGNDMSTQCTPGNYHQDFGNWNGGTQGIMNTLLGSIPVINGTYKLHVYDWAGGDSGSINDFQVCFDAPTGPVAYCTAGTSTNGCVPSIGANNNPSVTFANPCVITIANVEGQKTGLIFYGLTKLNPPLQWASTSNSFLCVKAPTQRMPTQSSGGTGGLCNGALVQDWNAYQIANPASLGHPFSVGQKFFAQGWYRDPPAPKTTNLSDALELTMQ